ncbi:MAG: glutamate-5-semialdehyde dehydrogenase [Firmicutes bacterium]|nr:glutamate-5-semialdehyde dehydrogenase [Bacillota bacterium]
MNIKEKAMKMKSVSPFMAASPTETRNKALKAVAEALLANKAEIIEENEKDLAAAKEREIPQPIIKRLKFNDAKIQDVISGINELIGLPDPLNKVQLKRELDEGLVLIRETCPIGVIGVIFEARPDAMVQVSTLCIKSGNCAVLKGGSEAKLTNRKLFSVIYDAVIGAGMPEGCMMLAETHDDIDNLLECYGAIDLLIPRGSNEFVQHIMNNTKIPVMGHADGICHIYVDKYADIEKAVPVIVDAKTQYAAACNAAETLLVHREAADALMPKLAEAFANNGVTLKGTQDIRAIVECEAADEKDFATEYLDNIISAKIVESAEEAIEHINKYGSHHTDSIITEDDDTADRFMQLVDSAGVYRNCSTRFADGFRYGFGAEVGISTSKLHARGPVGLEGLVTYKYKIFGNGHIVADYADGGKKFNFKDLEI